MRRLFWSNWEILKKNDHTIKDISIKILLDNESKILYDLSYKINL